MKRKPILLSLLGLFVLCIVVSMIYSSTPAGKAAATERSLTQTAKPTNTIRPSQTQRPTATNLPVDSPTVIPATATQEILPTVESRSNPAIASTPIDASSVCPTGCTEQQPGCAIKGNINSEGEKIYHLPGSSSYSATVIDPTKGELWFCSADEAESNGWRAPRN